MDAVATLQDPVTDTDIRGPQSVCAILVCRGQVLPWGIRLDVKPQQAKALGLPFRKSTELAAQLIRELKAPGASNVMVLCDAYALCHTGVQACREKRFCLASTLTGKRSLFKAGWQLRAGRDSKNRWRRRRTDTLVTVKPHGQARYRDIDAGGLKVSALGPWPIVFSRKGSARTILGLVTDAPVLSAAELIRRDEIRWTVEQFFQDSKPLLGLGHDQNRSYGAAVIHLHLVCCASALLTHLRIARPGAQGQRPRHKAAEVSTSMVQNQLRGRLWDALLTYLQENCHAESVLTELERLRVA
jgi:SRSO17 transposase